MSKYVTSPSDFIFFDNISDLEKQEALNRAIKQNKNTNFPNKFNARNLGGLGEVLPKERLPNMEYSNDGGIAWDLVFNKRDTIDCKSQGCNQEPLTTFDGNIFIKDIEKMKCDFIFFLRIYNNFKKAWLCGIISLEDFKKKGKLAKKGEMRTYGLVLEDKIELPYDQMLSPQHIFSPRNLARLA